MDIPECTWDSILIYFVIGLLRTPSRYDAAWVIVDKLTKLTNILPRWISWSLYKLAQTYIQKIVRLHGIPTAIVSNKKPRFMSKFWVALQEALGTKLHFSIACQPQIDGQTKRTIQTLEDMLRACVLEL